MPLSTQDGDMDDIEDELADLGLDEDENIMEEVETKKQPNKSNISAKSSRTNTPKSSRSTKVVEEDIVEEVMDEDKTSRTSTANLDKSSKPSSASSKGSRSSTPKSSKNSIVEEDIEDMEVTEEKLSSRTSTTSSKKSSKPTSASSKKSSSNKQSLSDFKWAEDDDIEEEILEEKSSERIISKKPESAKKKTPRTEISFNKPIDEDIEEEILEEKIEKQPWKPKAMSPKKLPLASPKKQSKSEVPKQNNVGESKGKEYVKVIQEYDSTRADELSISVGDIIQVVTKFPDTWWEGQLNGKKGLFPSTFSEPYDETSAQKASSSDDPWEMNFNKLPDEPVPVKNENYHEKSKTKDNSDEEESEEEDSEDDDSDEEFDEDSDEEPSDEEDSDDEEEDEEEQVIVKEKKPKTPVKQQVLKQLPPINKPKQVEEIPKLDKEKSVDKKPVPKMSAKTPPKSRSLLQKEKKVTRVPSVHKPVLFKKPHSAIGPWEDESKKDEGMDTRRTDPPVKKTTSKLEKQFLSGLTGNDIRKYRDALVAKEREISELRKEIKVLNTLQKRQSKAIKNLDDEKGSLPHMVGQFAEEVRSLKERVREYQSKHATDEKSIQQQHEEIMDLKAKVQEMTRDMKTKNLDETTVGKKVMKEVAKKEKIIENLATKNSILYKLKEQDEKRLKMQLKEANGEVEKLKGELFKYKAIFQENGLNRVVRDGELSKLTPPKRSKKSNSEIGSPNSSQEIKDSPSPKKKDRKEKKKEKKEKERNYNSEPEENTPIKTAKVQVEAKAEEAKASSSSKSPPSETETAAAPNPPTEANKSSADPPAFWRKTKTKDLSNPFQKLNEPAPEVVAKPATPAKTPQYAYTPSFGVAPPTAVATANPIPVQSQDVVPPAPVSTQPSRPSWLPGPPMAPVVQTDSFKPNFGAVGFGRPRKSEPWKQSFT